MGWDECRYRTDQNPSAAADELRCNQKSTRCAASEDHPLSTTKKRQPPKVSSSRGMAMLLSIVSPEATAHAAAVQLLAPIKFFTLLLFGSSPPRRCGNIAGYPTHNRKAARTMIGLRGQRCRTRPPMVSLSLSVSWSAPPQVVLALDGGVCVRAADQKCLLQHFSMLLTRDLGGPRKSRISETVRYREDGEDTATACDAAVCKP